jgi:hypothetical protein
LRTYYLQPVSVNKARASSSIVEATGAIHVPYSGDRQRELFRRDVLFSARLNKGE